MLEEKDILFETCLQFFGSVTASISHELKNALAVINENGGLLEDLALRAEKGIPIEPGRLKTVSERVTRQINRTEGIIKNMNRFAHSADQWMTSADLNEIAALSAAVAERLVAMRECTLNLDLCEQPVTIQSSPFCLEALIWHCLLFAAKHAGDARTIRLSVARSKRNGVVRVGGFGRRPEDGEAGFPTERENALLSALNAKITLDGASGVLELSIPAVGDA